MGVLSSTKPDAWTLSPQMTAAPELWRGQGFVLAIWEGSGLPMELSRGVFPVNFYEAGEFSWGLDQAGRHISVSPSLESDYLDYQHEYISGWNEVTVAGIVTRSSSEDAAFLSDGETTPGANGDAQKLNVRYDPSGFSSGGSNMFNFAFGGDNVELGDGKFTTNRFPFVLTADSSTATLYMENGYKDTKSLSPTLPVTSSGIHVGTGAKGAFAGDVSILVVRPIAWTEATARSFLQDLTRMLRPAGF